jgi:ABC-type uncharacterized transport system permease subunit
LNEVVVMDFFVNWLANAPSFAVPYALATLGLIVCEKSGVLNLGAEGYLLVGALAGVGAMLSLGHMPVLALAIAAAAAGILSLLFALLVIVLRLNQVIAGLLIVFFAQGLTSLIAARYGWTNKTFSGLGDLPLWPLSELPVLGRILFNQDIVVYLSLPTFALAVYILASTNAGMRLRAVGENPQAADAVGISVVRNRLAAVVVGGMLVGLAGGYLTVVVSKIWVDNMAGGRGWIAIALVIFARWQPWRAFLGALVFGCIEALIPRMAAIGLQVPQYFVLMLPYAATLAVMVWTSMARGGRIGQPEALGLPFVREERR